MLQSTIKNRTIFCKDNLDILKGINSNTIDLIYLDPPFNKKKVFTAPIGSSAEGASFKDWFRLEDVKQEWVESIKEDNEKLHNFLLGIKNIDGRNSYNFCYVAYMAIRLIECHRILKHTGSIYLHCDPTMSHYIKIMMDCIFGEKQFRNEIIWHYKKWSNTTSNFQKNHDTILRYSKTDTFIFHVQYQDYADEKYIENTIRIRDKNNKLVRVKDKQGAYVKRKIVKKGVSMHDVFNDISWGATNKERIGYPTQKPLALLQRIIKASSNKGDVVLDPFCGCATTCVAAEQLDRQWVGIDISFMAYELVRERLSKEVHPTLFEVDKKPYFYTDSPKRTDTGKDYQHQKYVYVISNKAYPNEYKVGVALNLKQRLNSYQTSDPNRGYDDEYSVLTPHYRALEKHIHNTFENKHEWVRADLQDIKDEINAYLKDK